MASYSSRAHTDFLKKTQENYSQYRDISSLKSQAEILEASTSRKFPIKQDLSSLVPPMVVNPAQKHFLKFWFGTDNADKILQNRQQIYNGQVASQCPNFDDPDATVPYINFATQKLECRVPIPNRTPTEGKDIDCVAYAQNGPNPFAIEKYVRNDGVAVCRVPVTRGKWFCVEKPKESDPNYKEQEKKYNNASDQYKGTHLTLPDGTGICVPPSDVNPHKPTPKEDIRKKYAVFGKLFADRIVQTPTPSEVLNSPYYSIFHKHRFNEGQVSMVAEAIKLGRADGKQKIIEYLNTMNDPLNGLFTESIKALYSDNMPDAIYRYHRDLYYYLKEKYPNYFQGNIPKEDRMRFLGYEGNNVFTN
jgi:hypothetical protein